MSYDYHKLLSGLIHLTDLQSGRCQTGRWGWVMLWGRNLRFTWSFGAICFFCSLRIFTTLSIPRFPTLPNWACGRKSFFEGWYESSFIIDVGSYQWIAHVYIINSNTRGQHLSPNDMGHLRVGTKRLRDPSIWNTRSIIHFVPEHGNREKKPFNN